MNKRTLIITAVLISIAALAFPFCIKSENDSIISILSLSFTALSAVGTLCTLIFAILIFDRFSLKGKFIENQTNKVFELIDELKGRVLTVQSTVDGMGILLRFTGEEHIKMSELPPIQNVKKCKILIDIENYNQATKKILEIGRSYWLPKEIKEKMKFLEVAAVVKLNIGNDLNSYYLQLIIDDRSGKENKNGKKEQLEWLNRMPELTLEELITSMDSLVKEIENWLKKYSEVQLDLELEEPEFYHKKG